MNDLFPCIKEYNSMVQLLLSQADELFQRFKVLEEENKKLRTENAQLKERLNSNSSNSSLPPSSGFKKLRNTRPSSRKKAGGQRGHLGHYRELLPSDQADIVIPCRLASHCTCGGRIQAGNAIMRHQVYELPTLKLQVMEYQLEKGYCENCDRKHVALLPEGVTFGITGSRLTSFMTALTTRYGLSRREQRGFLEEYFHFRISLRTVFNKQKIVNAAMAAPVLELLPLIKNSVSVHCDETSHNRDGKNYWMWGWISNIAGYFSIYRSRGKQVLCSVMSDFKHILVSDRYGVYNYFDNQQRQLCWAHLKRDFTKLKEKDHAFIARLGTGLLECETDLFARWHQFQAGALTREGLKQKTLPIRQRVSNLL